MLWFLLCSKIITLVTAGWEAAVLCGSGVPGLRQEATATPCIKISDVAHSVGKAEEEAACYTTLPLKM